MRVPAKDIALINHHRRDLGLRPIDLDAGWTHEELQNMAATLHARGRLPNPRFSKEELKEAKDRETDRALDNRGGALGRAFLGSWVGGAVGSLAGPVGTKVGSAVGGYYGPERFWQPAGIDGSGELAKRQKERLASAALGGAIGGLLAGPLGSALGAYIGAGKVSKKNPYAYDEYRHLDDKEREKLLDFIMAAQEAKVQAELARSRGDYRRAREYDKKHEAAAEKLFQLEERLAVSHKGPSRGRVRRRNGG